MHAYKENKDSEEEDLGKSLYGINPTLDHACSLIFL
jgi:hypothetical protein